MLKNRLFEWPARLLLLIGFIASACNLSSLQPATETPMPTNTSTPTPTNTPTRTQTYTPTATATGFPTPAFHPIFMNGAEVNAYVLERDQQDCPVVDPKYSHRYWVIVVFSSDGKNADVYSNKCTLIFNLPDTTDPMKQVGKKQGAEGTETTIVIGSNSNRVIYGLHWKWSLVVSKDGSIAGIEAPERNFYQDFDPENAQLFNGTLIQPEVDDSFTYVRTYTQQWIATHTAAAASSTAQASITPSPTLTRTPRPTPTQ